MTFTDSRIEIANRRTTLYYFTGNPVPDAPLPFSSKAEYNKFYATLATGASPAAVLLNKLNVFYSDNKYWRRTLKDAPGPRLAWANLIPVACSIAPVIKLSPPPGLTARVLVKPTVLLYPFGWSVWLSLRLLGDHTLGQLSSLAASLCNEPAWEMGVITGLRLQDLLDRIADGVRTDAFGGKENEDSEAADKIIVTTVLAKSGGSPSLGGISEEQQTHIKTLVRPQGKPSQKSAKEMAVAIGEDRNLNYVVIDKFGRFVWLEQLLKTDDPQFARNYSWLRCYHNNSFHALLQAWQAAGLAGAAKDIEKPPDALTSAVLQAKKQLSEPSFVNASVRAYLASDEVKALLPKKKPDDG